jgi:hypothetical protein
MVAGTVYHSYVWWYLGQSITATFDGICDSLSQLRFRVPRTVYHSYIWWYLWLSTTATFDGTSDSLSQLRLILSGTVYHSYFWWYLWPSITATFDGTWDSQLQQDTTDCTSQFTVFISQLDIPRKSKISDYNKTAINVQRNLEAPSCHHCFCVTAILITYSECIVVALDIQPAIPMRRTVICGLPSSTIFFLIFS